MSRTPIEIWSIMVISPSWGHENATIVRAN